MNPVRDDPTVRDAETDQLVRVLLETLSKEAARCVGAGESRLFFSPREAGPAGDGSNIRCVFGPCEAGGAMELSSPYPGSQFTPADHRFASALAGFGARAAAAVRECRALRRDTALLRCEKERDERYASIGTMAMGLLPTITGPLSLVSERCRSLRASCGAATSGRYLEEIAKGLGRIERIVSSLLSDAPPERAESAHTDLASLLDESIEMFTGGLARDVRICRDYEPGLCASAGRGLGHVFVNIIKNALEAMPQGGELLVTARRGAGGVRVGFTDTGTGIPAKFRDRIFEPFFTTREHGGTGLGLSISREIVKNCGGEIEVESLPGKGSSFTVFIPYRGDAGEPIKEVPECPRGR